MNDLFIDNIGCLATPHGYAARKGGAQDEISVLKDCNILIRDGKIAEIGADVRHPGGVPRLNAGGKLVTPGLVDCHTHLVFGGWRDKEFSLKLAGVPYLEILQKGGGILSTVDSTRAASARELYDKAHALLDEALSYGVTTLEAKSGYGLDEDTELKCLDAARRLDSGHPVDIVPTYMGAHALPREFAHNRRGYLDRVIHEVLPKAAGLAEYCDVFCERSAFDPGEAEEILRAAKRCGLGLKMHADEIHDLGGAKLAAGLGCVSAEHLIQISGEGIAAIAASDTVAVLLPCTSFYLGERFAPAKEILRAGGSVAVATDFNPGSTPNINMQLALSMACYQYRLSPAEILTAATLNAAAAVGRAASVGSAEPGKQGDLVVWNAHSLDYLLYRYGGNMAKAVIKKGRIVYANGQNG